MLELKNVSAGYNKELVLKKISLRVNENENLCILGPNGCGKTTLIKAVSGLIPYDGSITLNKTEIKNMKRSDVAANIAVMSQISSVYFSYSVFETVLLGRYNYIKNNAFKTPDKLDREYAIKCIKAVGLYNLKDKQINTLSGGQLQRVYLARTLAQDPKIILLDEPTNHLDLKYQAELIDYLKEWSKTDGHSVIGVFHDINLALKLADKVLFLKDGKTAIYGKTDRVISSELLNEIYDMDVTEFMLDSLKQWEEIKYKRIYNTKIRKVK